jgi:hypothetical protein
MGGEALHKKIVDGEMRALVAGVVSRAVDHSGLSKKQAALEMGYGDDQSPISRWVTGIEPPSFARMVSVPALRYGLSVALAELNDGVEIRTIVTFPGKRLA